MDVMPPPPASPAVPPPDSSHLAYAAYAPQRLHIRLRNVLRFIRSQAKRIQNGQLPELQAACLVFSAAAARSVLRGAVLKTGCIRTLRANKFAVQRGQVQCLFLQFRLDDAADELRITRGATSRLAVAYMELLTELVDRIPWNQLNEAAVHVCLSTLAYLAPQIQQLVSPPAQQAALPDASR